MAKVVQVIFAGDTKDFSRAVAEVDRESSRLSGIAKKAGVAVAAGLAAAGVAAFKFGKDSSAAYLEFKAGSLQTEAVLKSTGGAARVTAADVDTLTGALSRKAKIDDDEIRIGTNLLLTFTNIRNEVGAGNDIFNQANAVMLDLATAMGTDANGAAIQLGKALNDPIAGISALTRVGVSFTDEQKLQIKTMVEAGDTMGAQKIILAELNKEFGGSAEAAGKARGPMADVALALDTVQTSIGKVLHESFLPGLIKGFTDGAGNGRTLAESAELIGKKIEEAAPKVAKAAEDIARGLTKAYDAGKKIYDIIVKIDQFGNKFDSGDEWIKEKLSGLNKNVVIVQSEGGALPGRAHGGPVVSGQSYLVGEQGPEMFVPGTSGSIGPRRGGAGSGGGDSSSTTVIVQIDGRDLAASVQRYQVRNGIINSGSGIPA